MRCWRRTPRTCASCSRTCPSPSTNRRPCPRRPAPPPPGAPSRMFLVGGGVLGGASGWPPPRIALPDAVLGERVGVPFVTGNAPSRGAARAAVEVLVLLAPTCPPCAARAASLID